MELKIKRLNATLALIWCEGGKVRDIKSGRVFSEIEASCAEWESDENVLAHYEAL